MYVKKNFGLAAILKFSGRHIIWITAWSALVALLFKFLGEPDWLRIPWLPLSLIGTAVAFYIGFKNNSAYDRLWEARKIWGAIVNSSRAWGSMVKAFVSSQFSEGVKAEELHHLHRKLIYRHIAWLYALRSQLLIPTEWEHVTQGKYVRELAEKRRAEFGIGLYNDETTESELKNYLPADELERLINYKNTATQIIDQQASDLRELRSIDIIDDFRHMEMQNVLNDFYVHQGKCERIKKFPLPRQYGSSSFIFVGIFIFLLPFGMVSEFAKIGEMGIWLSIPFTALVSWVYIMMELVGDYSENPFEGMGNDIPMMALCRTIEIDMREMLGETDIPDGIKPKNGVLM